MRVIIRMLLGIPILMLAERRRKKRDWDCDLDFSDCADAFSGLGDSGDGGHGHHDGGSSGD